MNQLINEENKNTQEIQVTKNAEGKYKRITNYKNIATWTPSNDDEMIEYFQLLDSNSTSNVTPFKEIIGQQLVVVDFLTSAYDKVDPDTGEILNGVVTILKDENGKFYSTSSKAVYFTIERVYNIFPIERIRKGMVMEIVGEKRINGVQIMINMLGFKN